MGEQSLLDGLRLRFAGQTPSLKEVAASCEGRRLIDLFAPLARETAKRQASRYGARLYGPEGCELWGALWLALASTVRRLASNTKTDPLAEIKAELRRAVSDWHSEERGDLLPPSSTVAEYRKRTGRRELPTHWIHFRLPGNLQGNNERAVAQYRDESGAIDREVRVLLDPDTRAEFQTGSQSSPSIEEIVRDYAADDREARVLVLWLAECTYREIVEQLDVSLHVVRRTLQAIFDRYR